MNMNEESDKLLDAWIDLGGTALMGTVDPFDTADF